MGESVNRVKTRSSYSSAESFPMKVLLNKAIQEATAKGYVPPIHPSLYPTNRCNLNCEFCSCGERTKNLELDFEKAKRIIDILSKLGTQAVSISGGGEPLLYPQIEELIKYFVGFSIKVGLTTNGLLLDKINPEILNMVTWCRVSHDDNRKFEGDYPEMLAKVVKRCPDVDWAFSHIVFDEKRPIQTVANLVMFASEYNFTHVRIVCDILNPKPYLMEYVKGELERMGVDDSKVLYQLRAEYDVGHPCYICYLRPTIAPDGKVYACCGAQYALSDEQRDLPEELCLGDAENLEEIISNSGHPFDGSICKKCYYKNYNNCLAVMLNGLGNKEFV